MKNIKEDARITKTKSTLLSAFKVLLNEKSFEDITVNEICLKAEVRRATFYKHFTDKYAFLRYLVGRLRDDFDNTLSKKKPDATSAYYVEYINAIISFLTRNDGLVKNLLKSEVLPALIEVIKEKNYEDTCKRLEESVKDGMTLPASVEVTASMMTGAVANTLLAWFKSEKAIPAEALKAEMSAVIAAMQIAK